MPKTLGSLLTFAMLLVTAGNPLFAQRNRITSSVRNEERVTLTGHIHPKARAEFDHGKASADLVLPFVTLVLSHTADQQTELDQLLSQQQDPASPNFHRWLTPDDYATRFGATQDDVNKIVAWLQSQNLDVKSVSSGRNWIAFSGTAAQIQNALTTEIHTYVVDGETHYANATEPTIPTALVNVVKSVRGLHDFRMKPQQRALTPTPVSQEALLAPHYNNSKGSHYISPGDHSVIYNTKPLLTAGINGSGQKIAVVGQTQIKLSDIQYFRTYFGLPANDPQIVLVPQTKDPGVQSGDMQEADLDVEWAGAVAPQATVIYVYSPDVMVSLQYAVSQNLAPVISMSYGSCEPDNTTSDVSLQRALAKQASAQGQSWFAASGDAGGADCGGGTGESAGLAVDMPGSLPEVTSVGGTTFSDTSGGYWNSTNDTTHSSALSYIPETSWNDSVADGSPSSSGGGASTLFSKPTWQTGPGVPADGARDVPDVALSASADHDGYLVYNNGSMVIIGGTSAGAPSFAGIAALINQYVVTKGYQSAGGLGSINPRLYSLAQSSPSAFHDITTGDNIVTACTVTRKNNCAGVTAVGYTAGVGYDLVTGLGSIDAYNLVTNWHDNSAVSKGSSAVTLSASSTSLGTADTTTLTASVQSVNGGTPTGSITFMAGSTSLGTATLVANGSGATATLSISATQLPVGATTVTAQYSGDSSYAVSTATLTITVQGLTGAPPTLKALANGASFRTTYAPGMLMSVFGTQLSPVTQAAQSVPLPVQLGGVSVTINGVTAPLYYVSPGQLNIQVPYEVTANTPATIVVNNNGQTSSTTFLPASAAVGIFTDANGAIVPSNTATRGQIVTLFLTGAGTLTPSLATGAAPAAGTSVSALPKPAQSVTVTVDGTPATVQFVGNTIGLVGVLQLNFQIPTSVGTGSRSVVVSVGGVASVPATINLQ